MSALVVSFELPSYAVSEANARGHWAKRHRRAQRQRGAVAWMAFIGAQSWPAIDTGPFVARLTRVAPRELDDDNLRPALKAVRDQVADTFGVTDRDRRIRWDYAQERRGVRDYAVRVEIERRTE